MTPSIEILLVPPLSLATLALGIGTVNGLRTRQRWMHWRLFGLLSLVVSGPAALLLGFDGRVHSLEFALVLPGLIFGFFGLTRPTSDAPAERLWRSLGSWLLAVAVVGLWFVFWTVISLFGKRIPGWFGAGVSVGLTLVQGVSLTGMIVAGLGALESGKAPEAQAYQHGFAAFVAIGSRLGAALYWGYFVLISPVAFEALGGLERLFVVVLVVPTAVAVVWVVGSAVQEVRALHLGKGKSRPTEF